MSEGENEEMTIAEDMVSEDEEMEQDNISSIVDAAVKKIKSDRMGIQSFCPTPPQVQSYSTASSLRHSMSIGPSYKSKSNLSTISNDSMTINVENSLVDSMEGCAADNIEEKLEDLPNSLDTALLLNHALQQRVSQTLQRLNQTLKENRTRQEMILIKREENTHANTHTSFRDSSQYFLRISSFCVPYFKDKSGRQPPRNEDALYKINNKYLDLYTTRTRRWMTKEISSLVKVVQERWYQQLYDDWVTEKKEAEIRLKNIDAMTNSPDKVKPLIKISNENRDELVNRIERCNAQLEILNSFEPIGIQIPANAPIDWNRVAAQAFDGHRTSEECELLWRNFCRPTLEQGPWTEAEDITIQKMVQMSENDVPDWSFIASSLVTQRSPFQVFQRWVSFIYPTLYPAKWTRYATEKLLETVSLLRSGSIIPWSQVQQHLVGFSCSQIQSKWRRINPDRSKGGFTVEEDFVLIKGLFKFKLDYEKIAYFMPGRLSHSIRNRVKRAIIPGLTVLPWTKEEDEKIIDYAASGARKWRLFASQKMIGRRATELRARHHIIQVWEHIKEEDDVDIPPLFPISLTRDEKEIHILRQEMLKERPDLILFIKNPNDGEVYKKMCIKPMEIRRNKLKNEKIASVASQVQKVQCKKGRKLGSTLDLITDWPDIELMDFFMPGRMKSSLQITIPLKGQKDIQILLLLKKLFRLRIVDRISKAELKILKALNIEQADIDAANFLCTNHNHPVDSDEKFTNCPGCIEPNTDQIPYIAPNHLTFAAYMSMILHQRKLTQMAQKVFLPYRMPKEQLLHLGTNSYTVLMSNGNAEETIEPNQSQEQNIEEEVKPKKIHITQGVPHKSQANKPFNRKGIHHTYTKADNSEVGSERPSPTKAQIHEQIKDSTSTPIKIDQSADKDVEQKKASDDLLFKRFASIFFWPAVAATCLPNEDNAIILEDRVIQNFSDNAKKWTRTNVPKEEDKFTGMYSKLDIAEQAILVKTLEEKRREKRENSITYKRKLEMENSKPAKRSYNVTYKERKKHNFTIDDLEEAKSPDVTIPEDILKATSQRKRVYQKSLLSIKRSLVMKKAWENRRKGKATDRVKTRDRIQYIPRGSRTRNKVRTEAMDIKLPKPKTKLQCEKEIIQEHLKLKTEN